MLKILTLTITALYQNARVVLDTEKGVAAVVDPGGEVDKILSTLRGAGAVCEQIWLTHSHLDHCGGARRLKSETGAKIYAHAADRFLRAKVTTEAEALGLSTTDFENCPEPDVFLDEGQVLHVGEHEFRVMHTPGHSPGHVAFYCAAQKTIISGDSLFSGAIGRTTLDGGDVAALFASIRGKILALPHDTIVMCGHGGDTTIGTELRTNAYVR